MDNELVMSPEQIQATLSSIPDDNQSQPTESHDTHERASWEDSYEDDSVDSDGHDTDVSAPAQKQAQTIREFKADGGVYKVDMTNQERVDELISLGLGSRRAFSERDKLRKLVSNKDKQLTDLTKYKDLWNKIEVARTQSKETLYEKVFGEKWTDAVQREVERHLRYQQASPEERLLMEQETRVSELKRAQEAREAEWRQQQEAVETKQREIELKEMRSLLMPAFQKYEFSNKVKDPDEAQERNTMLWTQAIRNIKRKYGETANQQPPRVLEKEFARIASLIAAGDAKQEVKQIIEEKKKEAKTKAQVASTQNYSGNEQYKKLAKEKDPVKLWRKMFGG